NSALDDVVVSRRSLLDGLELLCMAPIEQSVASWVDCDDLQLGAVRSMSDLGEVAKALICAADDIHEAASRTVLFNLPTQAVDALRIQSGTGAYPALAGEMQEAISLLRASIVELRGVGPIVASLANQLGYDIEELRNWSAQQGIQEDIEQLLLQKEVLPGNLWA